MIFWWDTLLCEEVVVFLYAWGKQAFVGNEAFKLLSSAQQIMFGVAILLSEE